MRRDPTGVPFGSTTRPKLFDPVELAPIYQNKQCLPGQFRRPVHWFQVRVNSALQQVQ